MPFVRSGGYEDKKYWDEEGQLFLKYRKAKHPVFWIPQEDGSFRFRTMTKVIDMPYNWPVEVNYLEAKAFCRWKSEKEGKKYRMPTESEWYFLYERSGIKDVPEFKDELFNINLKHFASSVPVNKFSFGEFYDIVGNVWQWTETPISGYPGFKVHPIYDDFSVPTFDGKHNMIKGGSWISTGNEIMKWSRYAFRRHFYQHAGFRYVEGDEVSSGKDNIYITDTVVSQNCEFQYGLEHLGLENYAKKYVQLVYGYTRNGSCNNALELGCGTGRGSFELAKFYDHVTGMDFSARFIQIGDQLKENGIIKYIRQEEGSLFSVHESSLSELGLEEVKSKVEFLQGDACNLKSRFTGYDLVLVTNLLDRLYEPEQFLTSIYERINPEGYLVISSPYDWNEKYTEKSKWLGGYRDRYGEEVRTIDRLKEILEKHFKLIDRIDLPFVIRDNPRNYRHCISEMTVWKLRDFVKC